MDLLIDISASLARFSNWLRCFFFFRLEVFKTKKAIKILRNNKWSIARLVLYCDLGSLKKKTNCGLYLAKNWYTSPWPPKYEFLKWRFLQVQHIQLTVNIPIIIWPYRLCFAQDNCASLRTLTFEIRWKVYHHLVGFSYVVFRRRGSSLILMFLLRWVVPRWFVRVVAFRYCPR